MGVGRRFFAGWTVHNRTMTELREPRHGVYAARMQGRAFPSMDFAQRLETVGLLRLPDDPFVLHPEEAKVLSPELSNGRAKSLSLQRGAALRGAGEGPDAPRAEGLMARFGDWAEALIDRIAPTYAGALERGRTSLRTRPVEAGAASPRKDDRRLHIDAFPSHPTGGRRILRVFSNINPQGEPRRWEVGEPFEVHAHRWIGRLRRPWPGEAWALEALGLTRARRTPYDALMLGLHDAAKLDDDYQRDAPRRAEAFAAGSTWIVFTDSTVHAAIEGRYALEQTFYLPLSALAAPEAAPLRILERLTGRGMC